MMGLTKKQIVMLAVLVFGTFVTVLNQTVVAPVLPSVMHEMNVDAATAQWLTTGFTLMNAIMIPITAFLIDRFSTKQLFLFSMGVFTLGSALAAWGPSFIVLLIGRLVQAVGAGVLMPLVMTVLMWTFPVERRGSAMGIFGIVIAFGPAIGPTVAGIIIDRTSWHVMFWIITVLSLVVILISVFVLEKGGDTNKDVHLDVLSVVLSTLGFGGLLYGLSLLGSGDISIPTIVATIVGVAAIIWFFRRQLSMEHPMLQVRVLQNKSFLIATIIGMIVQGALLAAGILIPICLQSYLGYSATVSGLVLMPGALIMAAMGPIAGRLFDRHGPRALSLIGTGVLLLTTIAFCFTGPNTTIPGITILYTVRLFSLSLVNMPITTWGMNALPNELVNHGTSVNNTLRQVAGSLGTAIIISVSTITTNAAQATMDPMAANFFGVDMAFVAASVLCLIAFIMAVIFVKQSPTQAKDKDRDNTRRSVMETIMKHDVFTMPETAKVSEVMATLVDKGVSAVPLVNAAGEATGFISDGDIMRYLSKRSTMVMDPIVMIMQATSETGDNKEFDKKLAALMEMPANVIGAKGIIGVDIHADLPEVCRVLGENHLKKVPVLDDGHIVGVINRSDITHYAMEQYLAERLLKNTPDDGEGNATDDLTGKGGNGTHGVGNMPTRAERIAEDAALPEDEAVEDEL